MTSFLLISSILFWSHTNLSIRICVEHSTHHKNFLYVGHHSNEVITLHLKSDTNQVYTCAKITHQQNLKKKTQQKKVEKRRKTRGMVWPMQAKEIEITKYNKRVFPFQMTASFHFEAT